MAFIGKSEDAKKRDAIDSRYAEYRDVKRKRDSGEYMCIPFYPKHTKLSKIIPGIIKGMLYKITAGSGIGKTQLTKELFCITPLEFIRNNPEVNIKIKIFYFALEEPIQDFIDSLVINRLAVKHGIRIDSVTLKGFGEDYPDSDVLDLIDECREDVKYYMSHIEVIDSVYNPTGMYKYCRSYSEKVGTHNWEDVEFMKKGVMTKDRIYSHYDQDDPNLHVIVIADHISLITGELDNKTKLRLTKHQAMAKWSTEYCKKQITKHWGWTVVNVQQQEQSNEKQHYTSSGTSVIEKTEPTLDGLANNKELQRDDYIIISLYSPDKFNFNEYHGYDISRFRDTFRAIRVLKNRVGPPNKYVHYMFDGATNRFVELPKPGEDHEKLKTAYNSADVLLGRR